MINGPTLLCDSGDFRRGWILDNIVLTTKCSRRIERISKRQNVSTSGREELQEVRYLERGLSANQCQPQVIIDTPANFNQHSKTTLKSCQHLPDQGSRTIEKKVWLGPCNRSCEAQGVPGSKAGADDKNMRCEAKEECHAS